MEIVTSIKSKADALVFAINKASENGESFDKEKVDEIFDYILSKINLPDVERELNACYMDALGDFISKYTKGIDGIMFRQEDKA